MATAPTAADAPPLTVDEFARLPRDDRPAELVRGRVVRMNPPRPYHGFVCSRIDRILGAFVDANDLGYLVTNDAGVITGRDPDTVRGADVAFYSFARVPRGTLPGDRYLDVAPDLVVEVASPGDRWPDLVVEVASPGDRWPDLVGKVAEYLRAGVAAVVVVDPARRNAQVYAADAPVRIVAEGEPLTLPGALPGFAADVARFFD